MLRSGLVGIFERLERSLDGHRMMYRISKVAARNDPADGEFRRGYRCAVQRMPGKVVATLEKAGVDSFNDGSPGVRLVPERS